MWNTPDLQNVSSVIEENNSPVQFQLWLDSERLMELAEARQTRYKSVFHHQ